MDPALDYRKAFIKKMDSTENKLAFLTCPVKGCEERLADKHYQAVQQGLNVELVRTKNSKGEQTNQSLYAGLGRFVDQHLEDGYCPNHFSTRLVR